MNEDKFDIMYNEVYDFLQILGDKYINKLPKDLYKFIESQQVSEYNFKIIMNNEIHKQLSNNALTFIAYLNLNYWCSEEAKNQLLLKYKENDDYMEEIAKQKYNTDNLFKNKPKVTDIEENIDEIAMVEYKKDSIFEKLKKFIVRIFKQ